MSAKTCETCSGVGSVHSGRFEPCHACGGKGHNIDANVRCAECKGSGDSEVEIMALCEQCHGTGHQPEEVPSTETTALAAYDTGTGREPAGTEPPQPAPATTPGPKSEQADAGARRIIGSVAIITSLLLAGYGYFQLDWRIEETIGAGLTALLASYFALTILYLLVKVTLKVVQYSLIFLAWLLVVTLVARFLGYSWPIEIFEFGVRLLDNLGLA
jgi:hypothetical protein